MANEQNLIPSNAKGGHHLTLEEQKKGGQASVIARRKKKTTAELIEKMLSSQAKGKNAEQIKQLANNLDDEDLTNNALLCAGLMKSAINGNVKAFETLQSYQSKAEEIDEADSTYQMPIADITKDFVDVYREMHRVFDGKSKVQEFILKGGRGSIKSNFWSAFVEETLKNDTQAHAVVTRRYKTDLRNSVYSQFIKTITRHNKLDEWEFTTSPLMAKYKKTGQCVLFVGADKPISLKSYNLPFGYVKVLINEECDEMAGIEQLDNIQDTFLRADAPSINIKVYNPPKSVNNFMNEYTASKVNDELTYISHSYYYNVPVEWLGKRFFERAEWFKEHKPMYYDNNYLGKVTGTGGAIFDNVEIREITDKEIETMPYFTHGLDYGYEHPQTFAKNYYDDETDTLYIVEEVWSKHCKNSTFARKIKQYKNVEIIADSARPDDIAEMNDWGFWIIGAKKRWGATKGRDYCWEWLQQCNKIVIDPVRCPHTAKEFTTLEFEQLKDGTFSSAYPTLDEDCVMANIYALNRVIMNSRREDVYADEEEIEEENEEL